MIPAFLPLTFILISRSHKMLPSTLYIMSHMHLHFFKFEVTMYLQWFRRCIYMKINFLYKALDIATSYFVGAWVLGNILCDLDPNSVWNFRTVTVYSYARMEVNRMYPDQTASRLPEYVSRWTRRQQLLWMAGIMLICSSEHNRHVQIQRGDRGSGPPLENHKLYGFL